MPVVPKLEDSVQRSQLPNVKVDVSAPIEAFGGGQALARASNAIQGTVGAAIEFAKEEKKQADSLLVDGIAEQGEKEQLRLLWEPGKGLYYRKGADAADVIEDYGKQYTDFWDKQVKKAKNQDQAAALQKIRTSQQNELYSHAVKHHFTQYMEHSEEMTKRSIETYTNKIALNYSDNRVFTNSLATLKERVTSNLYRKGIRDEDAVKDAVGEVTSKAVRASIEAAVNAGDDGLADQLFNERRDLLTTPGDLKQVTDLIESSDRKGRAAYSKIKSLAGDNEEKQNAELNKIDNKKVRDSAREFLDDDRKAKQNTLQKQYDDGFNYLWDKQASGKKLTPNEVQMKKNLPANLERQLDAQLKDNRGEDAATWYTLTQEWSNEATRAKFLKRNLLEVRGQLSDSQFKDLAEKQAKGLKKDPDSVGLISKVKIVEAKLNEAKINNKSLRAKFLNMVNDRVMMHESRINGKASPTDVVKIVDDLMKEETIVDGGLFYFDSKKRRYNFTLEDVPAGVQKVIGDEYLKNFKRAPTEQEVLDAYFNALETVRRSKEKKGTP